MTTQPKALRLADELTNPWEIDHITLRRAASELRRLHSLNADLLEALAALETLFAPCASDSTQAHWIDKARAAIAKALGAA